MVLAAMFTVPLLALSILLSLGEFTAPFQNVKTLAVGTLFLAIGVTGGILSCSRRWRPVGAGMLLGFVLAVFLAGICFAR
jgi:hypothetical protein